MARDVFMLRSLQSMVAAANTAPMRRGRAKDGKKVKHHHEKTFKTSTLKTQLMAHHMILLTKFVSGCFCALLVIGAFVVFVYMRPVSPHYLVAWGVNKKL